jgi:hypothetical protein
MSYLLVLLAAVIRNVKRAGREGGGALRRRSKEAAMCGYWQWWRKKSGLYVKSAGVEGSDKVSLLKGMVFAPQSGMACLQQLSRSTQNFGSFCPWDAIG